MTKFGCHSSYMGPALLRVYIITFSSISRWKLVMASPQLHHNCDYQYPNYRYIWKSLSQTPSHEIHRTCTYCFLARAPSDVVKLYTNYSQWWRNQMEKFSALLAFSAGNSQVTGKFPTQRPVMRSFDVFFNLGLNKRFSKQSRRWWF